MECADTQLESWKPLSIVSLGLFHYFNFIVSRFSGIFHKWQFLYSLLTQNIFPNAKEIKIPTLELDPENQKLPADLSDPCQSLSPQVWRLERVWAVYTILGRIRLRLTPSAFSSYLLQKVSRSMNENLCPLGGNAKNVSSL